MFTKDKNQRSRFGIEEGENETIIGPSVKVEGDFVSDGNVLVQGIVNGSLHTKGNLRVEMGAKIKASVEAANAIIRGQVKGNIIIQENLEIGESAVVEGDVVAKVIAVAPGAAINGHCLVAAAERVNRAVDAEPALVQRPTTERRGA